MRTRILTLLLSLATLGATAQQAVELKQKSLSRWDIGTANFSGITPLGNNRFALVSDKEPADGFFVFRIFQDSISGQIEDVQLEHFAGNVRARLDAKGLSVRDCEGIAYMPETGTVFISGEGDQQILEYAPDGQPTGRGLAIPAIFALERIVPNYGFEALCYDAAAQRFWTTTESTLRADGPAVTPLLPAATNLLRLQSFGADLQPAAAYAYRMDAGQTKRQGRLYALGVPALCALPDGRLLVLEREVDISPNYLNSRVECKFFVVNPAEGWKIDSATDLAKLDPNKFLTKTLIAHFTTRLTAFKRSFANYEGMCLGRPLADGRQTLILVSDSQGNAGKGPIRLKDFLKVLVLP